MAHNIYRLYHSGTCEEQPLAKSNHFGIFLGWLLFAGLTVFVFSTRGNSIISLKRRCVYVKANICISLLAKHAPPGDCPFRMWSSKKSIF